LPLSEGAWQAGPGKAPSLPGGLYHPRDAGATAGAATPASGTRGPLRALYVKANILFE